MKPAKPAKETAPVWQVVLFGFVMLLIFLVWAIGFDVAAKAISGTWIDNALSFLSNAWLIIVMAGMAIFVVFAAFNKPRQ